MSALPNKPTLGQFLADVPRFTSGETCTLLLLTLLVKTPVESEWIGAMIADLAQICRCSDEAIVRELEFLQNQHIAEVKVSASQGIAMVRLRFAAWEGLPDYKGEKH